MSALRLLKQVLYSVGTRIAMVALRLARNALLARILGPADRGLFAMLNALAELLASLGGGGLQHAAAYQAANRAPVSALVTLILVLGSGMALLTAAVGTGVLQWPALQQQLGEDMQGLVWLLLLAVPLIVLKTVLTAMSNALGDIHGFNLLRLTESLAPLLLFLALFGWWYSAGLSVAIISWLAGLGLVIMLALVLTHRAHSLRPAWSTPLARDLWHYGKRGQMEPVFQQILLRGDILLAGAMLGPEAAGFLAIAKAAGELLLIIPESVTTPLMKRLLGQSDNIAQWIPLALRLTLAIMFVAAGALALLGHWLIGLLFGKDFLPAYPAMLAMLPGVIALCHASILRFDLLGKGLPGRVTLLTALMMVIGLSLAIWLIPHYGMTGAAAASSVAFVIGSMVLLALYSRHGGVAWYRTLVLTPADIRLILGHLRKGPRS